MSKEKLITQFKGKTFSSNEQVIRWLEKAIAQTREETIRLEQERIYAYVEEILIGCDNKLLKDLSNIIFNKSN
jgi:hypothetical protein